MNGIQPYQIHVAPPKDVTFTAQKQWLFIPWLIMETNGSADSASVSDTPVGQTSVTDRMGKSTSVTGPKQENGQRSVVHVHPIAKSVANGHLKWTWNWCPGRGRAVHTHYPPGSLLLTSVPALCPRPARMWQDSQASLVLGLPRRHPVTRFRPRSEERVSVLLRGTGTHTQTEWSCVFS